MATLYEAAGGIAGLTRLAHAWHEQAVADPVVGHAFSHGSDPHHADRIAAYWAQALGGPPLYSERYGDESAVVRMHSGNGVHSEMDDAAIAAFDRALADVGYDAPVAGALQDYWAWATRTTMAAYPRSADDVPEGLRQPRWDWRGLVPASGTEAGS